MTSPVTSTPYSYLNVLNSTSANPLVDPVAAGATGVATPPADTTATTPATAPATGSGNVQLSSNLVALLQQLLTGSGSADSTVNTLLGGGSSFTSSLFGGTTSSLTAGTPVGGISQQAYATALTAASNGAQAAQDITNGNQAFQNAFASYQAVLQAQYPASGSGGATSA